MKAGHHGPPFWPYRGHVVKRYSVRTASSAAVVGLIGSLFVGVPVSEATFPSWGNGRIAYVAPSSEGFDIFSVRADGTRTRQLTRLGNARDPQFSANGRAIAFTYAGVLSRDVWVMRANGADELPLIAGPANESSPVWSPDGEWLAYASDESGRRMVHLYEVATGVQTQLTFPDDHLLAAWSPAWSPDGERIAFVAKVPTGLDPDEVEFYYKHWHVVMTVEPDGESLTRVTETYWAMRPTWTPNGSRILYTNYGESYRNYCPLPTYLVKPDGSDGRYAGIGTCYERDAVRSPNGRRLAIWSSGTSNPDRSDKPGLYVAAADGSGKTRLTRRIRPGLGIDWQPR